MKIGIITHHFTPNYGAMLQAYALQTSLKQLGHESYFVYLRRDYQLTNKYERPGGKSPKELVLYLAFQLFRGPLRRRHARFEAFLADELHLTPRYSSEQDFMDHLPDLSCYICGSDQIWNLQNGLNEFYYGRFIPESVKLMSYAASFGNVDIPKKYTEDVKFLLNRFDRISVREESGCEMVRELTSREVTRAIDPVFLIEKRFWEGLATQPTFKKPYILFYALEISAETSSIVTRIAKKVKMPVVIIAKGGAFMLTCRTRIAIDAGPREFLGWIMGASLVLTNSFHSTAFAMIFNVPFVTIAHSHRNTRMENLLHLAQLEERLVQNASELDNWSRERLLKSSGVVAEKNLRKEIEVSKQYLKSSLE